MDSALPLWEKAAQLHHTPAYIEMAMYYEHQAGDVESAIYWTQAAIEILDSARVTFLEKKAFLAELEHRLNRLERKRALNGK